MQREIDIEIKKEGDVESVFIKQKDVAQTWVGRNNEDVFSINILLQHLQDNSIELVKSKKVDSHAVLSTLSVSQPILLQMYIAINALLTSEEHIFVEKITTLGGRINKN
jgi:hypothetical protein